MFFRRKKTELNLERFDGFHIQSNHDCKGKLKTLFFELQKKKTDDSRIEVMKPFGYPVNLSGNIIEVQRDEFFRLMIPMGQKNFHAEFVTDCDKDARQCLMNQVYRWANGIVRTGLLEMCPEDAIDLTGKVFTIDLKKCTYCLDCVT